MAVALHIKHRWIAKITTDTAGTQKVLDRDNEVVFDQYKEAGSSIFDLPAAAVDASLPMLGLANAQLIYLETELQITLKVNLVGNTAITIRPNPTQGAIGKFFLETTGLTAVFLSNANAAPVRIWYALAGD